MGVPGLWDLLRPAAARTSLSALSKEAFQSNRNGLRAFTIGIDASIWIFHAQVTHHGENPFLRTIFFKITALLQQPVLPVFVFDGPRKPGQKRNQNVAGQFGTADHKSRQFKALLDVCGLEWWNAPGEAEAELAVMNRQGKIDAVLSDDVDALLFGATCLLRNNSPTLSGAQASSTASGNSSRGDMRTYEIYRSSAIKDLWTKKEGTTLKTEEDCRMAMMLIALLGGGDYTPEGLPSIGPTISFGLANAGLSDFLKKYNTDRATFDTGLPSIHERIIEELRTNTSKQVGRRYPDRANKLSTLSPASVFPSFTLDAYLNPCTSPLDDLSQGWPGFGEGDPSRTRGKARNEGRGDMEGLAIACEKYFEWGTKEIVVKKFAGEAVGVFGAEIVEEARQTVKSRVEQSLPLPLVHQSVGTSKSASTSMITSFFSQSAPSSSPIFPKSSQSSQPQRHTDDDQEPPNHVLKIHSKRVDPTSVDGDLFEYRISFRQADYVRRCHESMQGIRVDPDDLSDGTRQNIGLREKSLDDDEVSSNVHVPTGNKPKDEIRVWIAEYLVKEAWPSLVQDWEDEKAAKANRSPKKKKKTLTKPPPKKGKGKANSLSVEKMNVGVFNAFYAAAGAAGTQRQAAVIDSSSGAESGEEEEELIENLPPRPRSRSRSRLGSSPTRSPPMPNLPGKKSKARPCPTSSLSSILDSSPSRSASPTSTPKARAKGAKPKYKTKRTTSPQPTFSVISDDDEPVEPIRSKSPRKSSSPKRWPFSKRIFSKLKSSPSTFASPSNKGIIGGKKDEPIDLCSSSSDGEGETPGKSSRRSRRSNSISKKDAMSLSSPMRDAEESTPVVKASRTRKSKTIESSPPRPASPILQPVLGNSSRANTLSPSSLPEFLDDTPTSKQNKSTGKNKSGSRPRSRSKSKSKSKSTDLPELQSASQQSTLDFPITAQSIFPKSHTPKPAKLRTKGETPSPKKKKKNYVVVSETSDEEVLDCTRRT